MRKSIGSGELDRKVHFGRAITYEDESYGGKDIVYVYTNKDVWAKVVFFGTPSVGASEAMMNDQKTGKVKVEVFVRFMTDIKFEDFIVFKGRYYEIYSIQVIGKREYLVLRAEWRDDIDPITT